MLSVATSSQSALLSDETPGKSNDYCDVYIANESCESGDDDEDEADDEEDAHHHPTGFDQFNDAAEFHKLIDAVLNIQSFFRSVTGNADINDRIFKWQVDMLKMDVDYIKSNIDGLRRSSRTRERAEKLLLQLMEAAQGDLKPDSPDFKKLLQTIARLKILVPRPEDNGFEVTDNSKKKKKDKNKNLITEEKTAADEIVKAMLKPKTQDVSRVDLLRSYESLTLVQKKCLLCFSILDFDEDEEQEAAGFIEIKRKVLIYWWVGEGFIDQLDHDQETVEEIGKQILKLLTEKGFIEMVSEKGRETGACRMHPVVHSFLTQRIMEADHIVTSNEKDELRRPLFAAACLVKSQHGLHSSCQHWAKQIKSTSPEKLTMFDNVRTLFNVNESIAYIKPEWLSKMKSMSVLHLGHWRSGATDHIEFADQKFLEELLNLRQMRLFSLQGVSTISKLPDSVCELGNLRILDLRECHQLEELPLQIGSLKNLTHLDISGCHLLTKLPLGISSLSKLEVLRGFVIYNKASGNRRDNYKKPSFIGRWCKRARKVCSFWDLRKLKKLKELSLVVEKKSFPDREELCIFKEMQNLRKLMITWQRSLRSNAEISKDEEDGEVKHDRVSECLSKVEKLGLWCFPLKMAPEWLVPKELKNLKKLYIKGGQLQLLRGDNYEGEWGVTTLRVKYLPNLKITWTELREMFPKMRYLEKYECKKLYLFPCDHQGVWRLDN